MKDLQLSPAGPTMPRWRMVFLLGVLLSLAAARAGAQPLLLAGRLDLSLSNPGARSLGFGGAFAALADDATAAYANPAGLVQLVKTEISAELRLWRQTPQFVAGGRIDGEPTGRGLDTSRELRLNRSSNDSFGPSFASVVLPRGRFTYALYGHRLADFESRSESQGFFFDLDGETGRFPAGREQAALEATSAGLAVGWKPHEQLSLGLGAVFTELAVRTDSHAFVPLGEEDQGDFEPIPFAPENLISRNSMRVDDTDLTFNAGLLWQMTERLSLGLFYRQGASGAGRIDTEIGPAAFPEELEPFEVPTRFVNPARFEVPDVAGAGLAYRSSDGRFTVATEVQRVGYEGLITAIPTDEIEIFGREYRDAWEYHLGAEYALPRASSLLAFRAGVWVEQNGADLLEEEVVHVSTGLGYAGSLVQVDLAADVSESGDTVALSLIYAF